MAMHNIGQILGNNPSAARQSRKSSIEQAINSLNESINYLESTIQGFDGVGCEVATAKDGVTGYPPNRPEFHIWGALPEELSILSDRVRKITEFLKDKMI